jgi:uncharacterized repeat protein (TIGR03803 family)
VTGGTAATLLAFNGTNGCEPYANLLLVGSTLYGTTYQGGAAGLGAVFSVPLTGGTATTLLSFNGTNGSGPRAGLVLGPDGSTLYGTTEGGGANGCGVVFSISSAGGTAATVFSFNGTNGYSPGDLLLSGSTLYGVTGGGGAYNDGTVFALALSAPEPGTLALLGAGAIGLVGYGLRHRRAAKSGRTTVFLARRQSTLLASVTATSAPKRHKTGMPI